MFKPTLVFAFIAAFAGGTLSAAEATAPVSSAKLIEDLKQLLPETTAVPFSDAAELPGEYKGNFLVPERYYVFPGGTYATVVMSDIGASYDEGKWTFAGGVLSLVSDDPLNHGLRKTKSLLPLTLTTKGKVERALVSPAEVAYWLDSAAGAATWITTGSPVPVVPLLTYAVRTRDFDPKEIAALKDELDMSYGKYSMYGLWAWFQVQCVVGSKTTDGAWILLGRRSKQPDALGLSDASGGPLTEIFGMQGNADGLAEITISGVKLRARQIEISRKFETVRLSGTVEIVGGKLLPAPGLEIWIEGKKVTP